MPSTLPEGEPVPDDGALPPEALAGVGHRGFGVYVHVPFCASRCGYCDFNTYTSAELAADPLGFMVDPGRGGSSVDAYLDAVEAELRLARRVLADAAPPATSVFFGGGTPTLLGPDQLARLLDRVADTFGLAADAEITTEANPESVDPPSLRALRRTGFNRISLGMQSTAPHVLAVLDRRHTPGRAAAAAGEARAAGFEHVNLDLIYGTPGETADDFDASLAAAVAAGADHVSAYSLIVEDGTRLAARIRRGELPMPSDDVAADRYLAAESALVAAGFAWYEVSNWSLEAPAQCRHNLIYWRGGDWWGFGPGAHSHVGGVRWWNVKHPSAYSGRLADGRTPAHARELLGPAERGLEEVMLRLRLAEGLPLAALGAAGRNAAGEALAEGLLEPGPYGRGRAALTLRGRLLADGVVLRLVADQGAELVADQEQTAACP